MEPPSGTRKRPWPGPAIQNERTSGEVLFPGSGNATTLLQEIKMACFSAPLAAAIATGIVRRGIAAKTVEQPGTISWATKLGWLEKLFFGGCILLAFEHVWHGEIIFKFPFLTGVRDGNTSEVLREIATVGSAMTVLIVAVWIGMLIVSSLIVKRGKTAEAEV